MVVRRVVIDALHLAEGGVVIKPVRRTIVKIDTRQDSYQIVARPVDEQPATELGIHHHLSIVEGHPVVVPARPGLTNSLQVTIGVVDKSDHSTPACR